MFSHCRARTGSAEFIALIANEVLERLVEQGRRSCQRPRLLSSIVGSANQYRHDQIQG